ncbi:AmmeMemoRadiSam system protein A [Salinispira pacifica]|uniref:Putative ACR n=1 Tax=Salinispira pacifica TaxID=1307761 RepID=V5WL04_9SPIO|nr:AmmeMemoRadiSam system protein A [Salinispira pacifica]AHC16229.1 putative ACR [Salinispira pacifica]
MSPDQASSGPSGLPSPNPRQKLLLLAYIRRVLRHDLGMEGTDSGDVPGHGSDSISASPFDPPAVSAVEFSGDERVLLKPFLSLRCGLFVTLKKSRELRGCIGRIVTDQPLEHSLAAVSRNAAFRDRRFPPLQAGELPECEISLSLLSPPEPAEGPEAFRVGEHGIIISLSGRSAVFLPEVAVEQGWDASHTLQRLCLKAGLPSHAWQDPRMSFQLFSSLHMSESDPDISPGAPS